MKCIYPRSKSKKRKSTNELTINFDDFYGTTFQDDWALLSKLSEMGSPFKFLAENLCDHFGITMEELQGSSKKRKFVYVRFYYAFFSQNVIRRMVSNTQYAPLRSLGSSIGRPSDLFVYYSHQFIDQYNTDKNYREKVKKFCLSKYGEEFWVETKKVLLSNGVRELD